jgi:biotin transport system substrate-specific component
MQIFAVGLVLVLLPGFLPLLSVAIYLLAGCVGLPVFAGFQGGISVLAGPAGGFLIGYLLAAIVICSIRYALDYPNKSGNDGKGKSGKRSLFDALLLILFLLISYAVGTAWYMCLSGVALLPALIACIIPFIIPDLLKLFLAATVAAILRKVL